jgi:hypothetical protein
MKDNFKETITLKVSNILGIYGILIGLLCFACSPPSNEKGSALKPPISNSTPSPLPSVTFHKWTPSEGLELLPIERVRSLTSEEIREIPTHLIPLIPIDKLQKLSREQFLSLTPNQISTLTVQQWSCPYKTGPVS